jgi:hypothetical protein
VGICLIFGLFVSSRIRSHKPLPFQRVILPTVLKVTNNFSNCRHISSAQSDSKLPTDDICNSNENGNLTLVEVGFAQVFEVGSRLMVKLGSGQWVCSSGSMGPALTQRSGLLLGCFCAVGFKFAFGFTVNQCFAGFLPVHRVTSGKIFSFLFGLPGKTGNGFLRVRGAMRFED